jgi:raffinose/stachyose/melibiose transport system substrate-binding protein
MKKTVVSILLTSAVILSAFSGCTSKKTGSGGDVNDGTEKQVKIEFFQQKREAVETFNKIIAEFEKKYPNIKVEQNTVPDADKIFITRIASGDMPDVFTHWPTNAEFISLCKEDRVLNLTNEPFMKNVSPSILNNVTVNDKQYALPIALNFMGIFYNTQKFGELGLSVPKTYSELIDTMKAIKDAGEVPIILPDKDAWTISQSHGLIRGTILPDVRKFYDDFEAGRVGIKDNADQRRIVEKLLELRNYGQQNSLATGYDQAIGEFATGKGLMFLQGIWAIPSIKKANPDFEFSLFPIPGDTEADTKIGVGVDLAVAANPDGKHLDAVKTFMAFLAETSTAQMYADLDKSPSAINGVKSEVKETEEIAKLIGQGKVTTTIVYPPGVENEKRREIQQLIASKDIDDFLENYEKIYKQGLESMK